MYTNHLWQGKHFCWDDLEFNHCSLGPVFPRRGIKQGVTVTWTALTGRKVQCGESHWLFAHKPPDGGEAHDAQGLLLRRVGQDHCRDDHEGERRVDGHARSVVRKDSVVSVAGLCAQFWAMPKIVVETGLTHLLMLDFVNPCGRRSQSAK